MNIETGVPVAESSEQRMFRLFAEYHQISAERNELVRKWAGPDLSLSGVSEEDTEKRLTERKVLDDSIARIEARQKEIYEEGVSLAGGQDLKVLYENWMRENGKLN